MTPPAGACAPRDLVQGWTAVLLWLVPGALVAVGAFVPAARTPLWLLSFSLMGGSCVVNARRCGRLHCHLTGPLFLLAALATGLAAVGVVAIPWTWILAGAAVGTALAFGVEWLRGRYVGTPVL